MSDQQRGDRAQRDTHRVAADFEWRWRDPAHLEAHRDEFHRSVEAILEELRPLVTERRPAASRLAASGHHRGDPQAREGFQRIGDLELHDDFELPEIVGESGLREVPADGTASFWAYRPGRTIPSHLCLGTREPTRHVCLWGRWESDGFVIHTIYPGRAAPREIHDPEIRLDELARSIEFWRVHAIITKEGAYSRTPH